MPQVNIGPLTSGPVLGRRNAGQGKKEGAHVRRERDRFFFLPSSVLDISSFRKNYMEVIERSQGNF